MHLLMPSALLQVPSSLQEASLPPPAPQPAGPSLRAWTRLQTSVTSVLASKVTCGAPSAGPRQEGAVCAPLAGAGERGIRHVRAVWGVGTWSPGGMDKMPHPAPMSAALGLEISWGTCPPGPSVSSRRMWGVEYHEYLSGFLILGGQQAGATPGWRPCLLERPIAQACGATGGGALLPQPLTAPSQPSLWFGDACSSVLGKLLAPVLSRSPLVMRPGSAGPPPLPCPTSLVHWGLLCVCPLSLEAFLL